MQAFLAPLKELADYQEILRNRTKGKGFLQITGSAGSQKTHFMYALGDGCSDRIIVFSSEEGARNCYEEYRFLDENVYYFPAKDLLFYYADIKGKYLLQQRLEVIRGIIEHRADGLTIITTIDAFLDGLPDVDEVIESVLSIDHTDSLDLIDLQQQLGSLGYERVEQVESPGQFAVRGGILDIYCLTEELPIRIELWGDEIDSIRTFDVESQRSIETLEHITIYPSNDVAKTKGVSFLDYFPISQSIVFLDEPNRLWERLEEAEQEYLKSSALRPEGVGAVDGTPLQVFGMSEVLRKVNAFSGIAFSTLESKNRGFTIRKTYGIHVTGVNPYHNSFELLTRDLKRLKRTGYRVVLLCRSVSRAKRLAEDLRDYDLHSFYSEDPSREVMPGELMVTYGHVTNGYEYPLLKFMVISERDIFGRPKRKKRRRHGGGKKLESFSQLKVGDYVVHENHGIGVYEGIEKIEVDKITKDYMKISYAQGGRLYVLATQLDLIQKYGDRDGKKPKIHTLGNASWGKTRKQVQGAVKEMAEDLVKLYAHRQEADGYCYEPDTVWQQEFEELFPFEETEDQIEAIEDTKRDMESKKIMDRLICGDVGYGKTEIALRAAFKAVQEGKQVVYLVPTTILASQHYHTFLQRMKDFPVRVDLLCRFRSTAQQKKTVEDLRKGLVDIVIGTHRVLSKDVQFKDLGLLVIDEEQRFGVTHKEKIKQLREDVDVLTLTATPIPRTLHMSLVGIRDLSVLEEAPLDRVPIQTYVLEYQEELLREAISREIARHGQVYYVYNRVNDIADIAGKIQALLPQAVVAYAHGQMNERQLEQIMMEFVQGEIDVLVSTTIIETGLDISNANTIVIHDADRFGLAQLYQLRGRVGRSNRLAYAYLFYRRDRLLKEVAEKRLAAIREYTDLGSGIKIAMRDLEIRGAGNLLGAAQSGHMEAVGYDLYCKMLQEAVGQLKGEQPKEVFTTTMDLNIDAFIPASYIPNEYQKLDIYKRIAAIEKEEERDEMVDELIDRFGEIPRQVQQLLQVATLKALANSAYVTHVEEKEDGIKFTMYERANVQVEKIPDLIQMYQGKLLFRADAPPYFLYQEKGQKKKREDKDVQEVVKKVLNDIKDLLVL